MTNNECFKVDSGANPHLLTIMTTPPTDGDLESVRKSHPDGNQCLTCANELELLKNADGLKPVGISTIERIELPLNAQSKVEVIQGLVCEGCVQSEDFKNMIMQYLIQVGFVNKVMVTVVMR